MAFIKKPFRRLSEGAEADTYIDLGELNFEGEELKSAVRDCGGDVAVVGKNVLMATPAGIKIDRAKIKGAF